jgi:hypothetical protein
MDKFKVRAYTIELYEDEVEAENEEDAKEKFMEKWENAEIVNEDTHFFFDDEEGFEVIDGIVAESEEGCE